MSLYANLGRDELDRIVTEQAAIVASLRSEVAAINLRIRDAEAAVTGATAEIQARKKRAAIEPSVSDHALVRYIERVQGISLDDIRDHILTDAVRTSIKAGASAVVVDGVRFVVNNGTLVTVIDDRKAKRVRPPRFYEVIDDAEAAE